MIRQRLGSESGLTIIEVLISATVFIIGFSIMIATLANLTSRLSVDELNTASQIAEDVMITTSARMDAIDLDTTIMRGEIAYLVERWVDTSERLAKVSVTVSRKSKSRVLVELYSEFVVPTE
jgi:Tfp pilus assembly protein PilV